ncbi:MAG: HNH endonuclease [Lachnospiraceae bacterium]|nr:HNH endonuclease [Lachnospiraceae bacterium]MBQ4530500.1 HNH endonuclease [Lachnospiraceae bacterium]
MKYKKIAKSDIFLRTAMWEVYGKKCLYCGVALDVRHIEVDHILPDNENEIMNSKDPDLLAYISELKKDGFEKNSIQNYALSCADCNKKKKNYAFKTSNFRFYHDYVARHTESIEEKMQRCKMGISKHVKESSIIGKFDKYDLTELFCDKQVVSCLEHIRFRYGLGEVRIDAFIPASYDGSMSCMLSFKELYQTDIFITYDEDVIKDFLFSGYQTDIKENSRKWCIYYDFLGDNSVFEIHLPNIRLKTSEETVAQMAKICDSLYEEYLLQETFINSVLGTEKFPKKSKNSYALFGMRSDLFQIFWEYMLNHKYDSKDDKEKNIFNLPYYRNDFFYIQPNMYHNDIASTYACIQVEKNGEYYDFIWRLGPSSVPSQELAEFDDNIKWTAIFTYKKIIEEFIPDAIREDNKNKHLAIWSFFSKKSNVSYDEEYLIDQKMIKSYMWDTEKN